MGDDDKQKIIDFPKRMHLTGVSELATISFF